jgi:hypothetical protein
MCYAKCRDFKCNKKALTHRGRTAWCNWTNEPCVPKGCTYSICYKRQLLEGGVCGFSIRRRTREDVRPEEMFKEEIRVRGKVAKKIGERSIF